MTVFGLQKFAPAMESRAYLDAAGLSGLQAVVVKQTTRGAEDYPDRRRYAARYPEGLGNVTHLVDGASPYLSKRFVDSQ